MKSNRSTPSLRRLLLAQLCLTLGTPFALAQTAPAPSAADTRDDKAKAVPVVENKDAPPSDKEMVTLSPSCY